MSIAASFHSVKTPRFIVLGEERQTIEGDADWLNNTPTRAPLTILVDSSSASSNAEPAHTQTRRIEWKAVENANKVNSVSKVNK
jgi:hypothetical protein